MCFINKNILIIKFFFRSIQHFGYNYKPRSLLASAKKKTNEYSGITNNHNPSTFNINCSEIDDNIIGMN